MRFTQDDDPTYGNALRAFRITTLTPTLYAEEPATPEPILKATGQGWRAWGMHQLDPVEVRPNQWLAVVDGIGPALPDTPLAVQFANGMSLDGISVRPNRVMAGGKVLLRYFLSGVSAAPTNSLAAFVHLGPGSSETVFQGDVGLDPTLEFYETLVQVPATAPSGWYEMRIGLYEPETGKRIALKGNGKRKDFRISRALQVTRH